MKKAKIYNYILFALLLMTVMTLVSLYGFSVIVVITEIVAGMSLVGNFWLEEASE